MIKIYFKIALRNIRRYSVHSILNVSGMAIGMACAILILLWVQDEWSYDRHFEHANDLYRVIEKQKSPNGEVSLMAPAPSALASALKNEFPEIVGSTRIMHTPLTLKKGDDFIEETVLAVDNDFLKMFNVRFVQGDIHTALNDPHNIVMTEETARKYFGNENALGKTLPSRGFLVTVTGVVKSFPSNTHIHFDYLISTLFFTGFGAHINDWNDPGRSYTYVELKKGTDRQTVDLKIRDFIKKNKKGSESEIFLQNIKEIHLYSSRKYNYDIGGLGDIAYVRILGLIAVFILLIACINFMNLSTAQSARRAREIGIRKVAGANKPKIIVQFLGESLLIVFVSLIIAMILVELLLPGYNNLVQKQLVVNYRSVGLFIGLIGILLFSGFLAGSYPAFYLSALKPLDIIRGLINKNPGNPQFRRVLVIFQFSLSILLIICTLIIGNQLSYMQNKKLGFNKDNIGYFMFPIRPGDPKLESLKKELLSNPDILSVTKGSNPFNIEYRTGGYNWEGKKLGDNVSFHQIGTDDDYAKTFQLEIKEGRYFSSEFPTDKSAIVINEKAVEELGFKNPIGQVLTNQQGSKLTVIGVVKDFHFQSLHYKIEPLMMRKSDSNNLIVRMKPDKITTTVDFIDKTFKSFDPGLPINFHFLDVDFDNLYLAEQRMGKIFGYFSLLAIVISCLGLIGLSSFMIGRRTKEIGIRKVNGAKSFEIFSFLSKEYLFWVLISIFISIPVAWYAMHLWLENFAYKTNMSWWIFAISGILALGIALITVSWQSWKAATRNPVEALRYE